MDKDAEEHLDASCDTQRRHALGGRQKHQTRPKREATRSTKSLKIEIHKK